MTSQTFEPNPAELILPRRAWQKKGRETPKRPPAHPYRSRPNKRKRIALARHRHRRRIQERSRARNR